MVRVTSDQKSLSTSTSTESPVNRPTKLLPIDELFLFLSYLATGCTQRELCHKFNIHRATSEVFSAYKSHCTFKALIGMSPHGALTFVSALFEGSISDKEIFRHSGISSLLTDDGYNGGQRVSDR
uniref:Si:dkey-177p2.16 n=2 Tax=Nothobranchius rachovii TaxID=451742 RepID=A0A1A8PT11_9TELE